MSLKNTSDSYGLVMRLIHWVSALFVLCLLSIGFYMTDLEFSPQKLEIYGIHKSFGMTVLGLVILRIIWRAFNPPPKHLESHAAWERWLAGTVHVLLYIGLIGMPLSGWAMSSAGDFANVYFGLFSFPHILPKDKMLFDIFREVHETTAYALLGAVGLHFIGALKHHILDKDGTLRRMGGNMVIAGIAAVLLALPIGIMVQQEILGEDMDEHAVASVATVPPQSTEGWVISLPQSTLGFEATQYGQTFQGQFERFSGSIVFDPKNLGASDVAIDIDITSIKTGSDERDEQAKGAEWFNVSQFPSAQFTSQSFEALPEANRYHVSGDLMIRGIKQTVSFPFTLETTQEDEKETAHMIADVPLSRLAFGIGQGAWESTDTIGDRVLVHIDLTAARAL